MNLRTEEESVPQTVLHVEPELDTQRTVHRFDQ